MAYLNYNQKNNQQPGGINTPQQQQQAPTTGAPAISSPAPLPVPQTQQQQARQSQKGSGQFVNLRGYIQQNQPKAQEISGAIGQNIGQQAQQIGQQVQKQQQELGARIAENQGRIAEQQQFGQQQIQAARAGQAQLDAQNVDRFRKIATGSEFFGNTQGLDTTGIQQNLSELGRYAQNVEQQPMRNELLRDTFQKVGQYGSGQRALDDMLLASSQPAMQNLVKSTQGALQQQKTGLLGAQEQASSQMGALRQLADTTKGQLQTQLGEQKTDLQKAVEQRAEQVRKERESLLKGLQQGKLTRQQAEQLGLQEGQMLFGQSGSGVGMSAAQSNDYIVSLANRLGMSVNDLISNKVGLGGIDYSGIIGGIKTGAEDVISREEDIAAGELAKLAGTGRDLFLNANVGGYEKTKGEQFQSLKDQLAAAQRNYDQTARDIALKNAAYEVGSVFAPQLAGDKAGVLQSGLFRTKDTGSGLEISGIDPYTFFTHGAGSILGQINPQRPGESGGVSWSAPRLVKSANGVDIVSAGNQPGYSGGPRTGNATLGTLSPSQLKALTGYANVEDYGRSMVQSSAQKAYDEALTKIRESLRPQTLRYVDEALAKDGGIMRSKYERFGRIRGKVTK